MGSADMLQQLPPAQALALGCLGDKWFHCHACQRSIRGAQFLHHLTGNAHFSRIRTQLAYAGMPVPAGAAAPPTGWPDAKTPAQTQQKTHLRQQPGLQRPAHRVNRKTTAFYKNLAADAMPPAGGAAPAAEAARAHARVRCALPARRHADLHSAPGSCTQLAPAGPSLA